MSVEVFLPADGTDRPYVCVTHPGVASEWYCWSPESGRWVHLSGPPRFTLRSVNSVEAARQQAEASQEE